MLNVRGTSASTKMCSKVTHYQVTRSQKHHFWISNHISFLFMSLHFTLYPTYLTYLTYLTTPRLVQLSNSSATLRPAGPGGSRRGRRGWRALHVCWKIHLTAVTAAMAAMRNPIEIPWNILSKMENFHKWDFYGFLINGDLGKIPCFFPINGVFNGKILAMNGKWMGFCYQVNGAGS